MNSSAPIGIFDSGVGGLTVMRKLIQIMPEENIVYFGDTARVPYGNKSKDTVLRYTHQIIRFLETKQVKAIVIACNTASAYALHEVEKELPIPILGVIQPGAEAAVGNTRNRRIGVIGTYATIGSRAYESSIKRINPQIEVFNKACPLFVPFVEEGMLEDVLTDGIIARYLEELRNARIDTLMLGCTHYPLLRSSIEKYMGSGVSCVDPSEVTSLAVKKILQANHLLNTQNQQPKYEFYVSDSAQKMVEFANRIMPFQIEDVQTIQIESF